MSPPASCSPLTGEAEVSTESPEDRSGTRKLDYGELERKRARDRKSQQAMRNRTKGTISGLTQQVQRLTQTLGEKDTLNTSLAARLSNVEAEVDTLRSQNAALRLQLMNQPSANQNLDTITFPRWQLPPQNVQPTCLSDQILQAFLARSRGEVAGPPSPGGEGAAVFSDKPNLCSLLDRRQRAVDALSNIAADMVCSYKEIESLPNRVAAFCNIASLFKWQMQLDRESWQQIAPFLRPIPEQLTTAHPAWIDRIPWPRLRKYLLDRPQITLDDFAAAYSSSFNVEWPYSPSLVITDVTPSREGACKVLHASPVYEEHMRQIRHWTVRGPFRTKFPEMAALIDLDNSSQGWERMPVAG